MLITFNISGHQDTMDEIYDFLGVSRRVSFPLNGYNHRDDPKYYFPTEYEKSQVRAAYAVTNEELFALLGQRLPGWDGPGGNQEEARNGGNKMPALVPHNEHPRKRHTDV